MLVEASGHPGGNTVRTLELGSEHAELRRLELAPEWTSVRKGLGSYAFLCYDTKEQVQARRIFDRIRQTGNPVAEQAFQTWSTARPYQMHHYLDQTDNNKESGGRRRSNNV